MNIFINDISKAYNGEVLEKETLEIDGTYKILGIKYIED